MMSHDMLIIVLCAILMIILIVYSFYKGPFTVNFCELYTHKSWHPSADLIRKLNRYDLCGDKQDDIFDKYIYWNGEIIAGIKGQTLVFKGTDSISDINKDTKLTFTHFRGGAVYTGILDIYKAIKPQLDIINCKRVVGWSLGAALAVMYAYDHNRNINQVFLFGQPPIFTKKFMNEYNESVGYKTRSYLHVYDLVVQPLLPLHNILTPNDLNAYRVGETTYIDNGDIAKLFTEGLGYYHMSYLDEE